MTGAVYNAFPEEGTTSGDLTFTGEVNMWLQNGATWNNQIQGQIGSSSGGKSFEGSIVSNLVGGDSADKAGNIFQSDANKLTIESIAVLLIFIMLMIMQVLVQKIIKQAIRLFKALLLAAV